MRRCERVAALWLAARGAGHARAALSAGSSRCHPEPSQQRRAWGAVAAGSGAKRNERARRDGCSGQHRGRGLLEAVGVEAQLRCSVKTRWLERALRGPETTRVTLLWVGPDRRISFAAALPSTVCLASLHPRSLPSCASTAAASTVVWADAARREAGRRSSFLGYGPAGALATPHASHTESGAAQVRQPVLLSARGGGWSARAQALRRPSEHYLDMHGPACARADRRWSTGPAFKPSLAAAYSSLPLAAAPQGARTCGRAGYLNDCRCSLAAVRRAAP